MVVKQCVDWLSYTVDWADAQIPAFEAGSSLWPALDRVACSKGEWMHCNPRNGYTVAYQMVSRPGLTVMWNPQMQEMGVHVNWSGSALQHVAYDRLSVDVWGLTTRVGRIDIAVDIDKKMDLALAREQFKSGMVDTLARKCKLLLGEDGDTLYVGSRTSQKFLRIYDKAAQQGITGDWFRIELECKGDFARGVFLHLLNEPDSDMRPVIRGFCDFNFLPEWEDMADSPTPTWTIPKAEKRSDREKWLLEIVAPAFADMICSSQEFREKWHERMFALLTSRVGEGDPFDGAADFDVK